MGAGCSSSAAGTLEVPDTPLLEVPPRPAYLATDLVGPPVIEKVGVGVVDRLIGQAAAFAETLCGLNDSLNGLLLDVRLSTGLLQGGFSIALTPSPIVDYFSVELLTADGGILELSEALRLRGQDLTSQGKIAALDAQLAQCLEGLASYFVRNIGKESLSLALNDAGNLVPKNPAQAPDPAVEAFNKAVLGMRSALGGNYLLALHLHKASGHGMPAFRAHVLKPPAPAAAPGTPPPREAPGPGHARSSPQSAKSSPGAPAAPAPAAATQANTQATSRSSGAGNDDGSVGALPAAGAAPPAHAATTGAGASAPAMLPLPAALSGWELATLLDQTACLNASRLHDALHSYHDANKRLAVALKETGLVRPGAVVLTSSRTVALAGTAAACPGPAPSPTAFASFTAARLESLSSTKSPAKGPRPTPRASASSKVDPEEAAAAPVQSLPHASRCVVGRAVEGLNGAAHRLAHAAAEAPGPASFAALLTHVLGELRDVVARCGGDAALEGYQPAVTFAPGPDNLTIAFNLDPRLEGPRATAWGCSIAPFPECLTPQVRRAWILLLELLRLHNSTATQLTRLERLAGAFDDGIRHRVGTAAADAAEARLSMKAAAAATRALLRNHVEIRECCQGALQTLRATLQLVRDEVAEAAQLAVVQCSFMSPLAWSVSLASSTSGMSPSPFVRASPSMAGSGAGSRASPTGTATAMAAAGAAASLSGIPTSPSRALNRDVASSIAASSLSSPGRAQLAAMSSASAVAAGGRSGDGRASGSPKCSSDRALAGSFSQGSATAVAAATAAVAGSRSLTGSPSRQGGGSGIGSGGVLASGSPPDSTQRPDQRTAQPVPGQGQLPPQPQPGSSPSRFAASASTPLLAPGLERSSPSKSAVASRVASRATSRILAATGAEPPTPGSPSTRRSTTDRSERLSGGWVPTDGQDKGAASVQPSGSSRTVAVTAAAAAAATASSARGSPYSSPRRSSVAARGAAGDGNGEEAVARGVLRRAAQSIGSRIRRGEGAAEPDLTDEYARTALAHLKLQGV